MRVMLLVCSGLLFLATAGLPNGYFTFLRIVVTIVAGSVVLEEIEKGVNLWVIYFGLIAILFNPIIPIHFYDKSIWMPIDIIVGLSFTLKAFLPKVEKKQE